VRDEFAKLPDGLMGLPDLLLFLKGPQHEWATWASRTDFLREFVKNAAAKQADDPAKPPLLKRSDKKINGKVAFHLVD
jgi:hypothetical protein